MHASVGLDVNVTLLIWFYVTHLLLAGRDTSRQTVWLGWHAAEKISAVPQGWLSRVRNPMLSVRAKASLTGTQT